MMDIDPKTGEILVMLGSRDYWNEEIEGKNNNATACNSPGSSFKPFAYITTFETWAGGPAPSCWIRRWNIRTRRAASHSCRRIRFPAPTRR